MAGIIVDHLGYSAAFLTAGGMASVALTLLVISMPETAPTAGNQVRACGDLKRVNALAFNMPLQALALD